MTKCPQCPSPEWEFERYNWATQRTASLWQVQQRVALLRVSEPVSIKNEESERPAAVAVCCLSKSPSVSSASGCGTSVSRSSKSTHTHATSDAIEVSEREPVVPTRLLTYWHWKNGVLAVSFANSHRYTGMFVTHSEIFAVVAVGFDKSIADRDLSVCVFLTSPLNVGTSVTETQQKFQKLLPVIERRPILFPRRVARFVFTTRASRPVTFAFCVWVLKGGAEHELLDWINIITRRRPGCQWVSLSN